MSSIDRVLIELIINIQYINNVNNLIDIFKPIRKELNMDNIIHILDVYDLIYPYYQAVGFILNKLNFNISELKAFKDKISKYDFYIERGKDHYDYDSHWQIYY